MEWVVTVFVGLLATVGIGGIIGGAAATAPSVRRRSFTVGSVAMTVAGVALMLSSIAGLKDTNALLGGFMMMIFGTGVSLPTLKGRSSGGDDEVVR
jgi:hypothetical protein